GQSGSPNGFGRPVVGDRVFFAASANPFGTNPSENCQVFSITTLENDLRQLTQFSAALHSDVGCYVFPNVAGCFVAAGTLSGDLATGALVFDSSCDPFGTNPTGTQLFAMHLDGTGLRQLTTLKGVVTAPDGSVDVELPGPTSQD